VIIFSKYSILRAMVTWLEIIQIRLPPELQRSFRFPEESSFGRPYLAKLRHLRHAAGEQRDFSSEPGELNRVCWLDSDSSLVGIDLHWLLVARELRSQGYPYSPLKGELRSYQEGSNQMLHETTYQ